MKIIVDAMGGDNAPQAPIEGALRAQKDLGVEILLTGRMEDITACLAKLGHQAPPQGMEMVPASQVIDMEEARARRQQKRRAEKEKKEEKELRAKQQNTRGKRAIRRSKTRRKIITGITIAIIVLLVFLLVFNIISLKKEQYDTKKEQQALKQQKAELQKELENAETPENIEAQARQQLRLIKPGEVLYMFPSEITDRDDSSTGGQKGDSSQ